MKLFGTDGIRGKANIWPMVPEVALRVGMAVGYVISKYKKSGKGIVVLGKDTRISGYIFEYAIASGLCSVGADVYLLGPMPTPGIGYLTKDMRADAGVVISASHNPYYDNGIKIFNDSGLKLSDSLEEEIEKLVVSDLLDRSPEKVGKVKRVVDAVGRYIVHLKRTFPANLSLDGIKIVVDCANGATYRVAPTVFDELGAHVIAIGVNPDGYNINDGCGSMFPETSRHKLLSVSADIAFAFDGDGDRCIVVDDEGFILDGDDILAICAGYMKEKGLLKGDAVVSTVMAGMGLEVSLKNMGLRLIRTQVGDRYVSETMISYGLSLGGEPSGHIIFGDFTTTGDGIITALQVARIVSDIGVPLSKLRKRWVIKFPKEERSVTVSKKVPIEETPFYNYVKIANEKISSCKGRVFVRYSGTEPKLRILVEGEDEVIVKELVDFVHQKAIELLGGEYEQG